MSEHIVFDRRAITRNRDRAAAGGTGGLFLFDEVARRLADRLLDIQRKFRVVLDLSAYGDLYAPIAAIDALSARGIEQFIESRETATTLRRRPAFVADPEALPVGAASVDLVLSVLSLHGVNDLPGTLVQIRRALRPDGLLLAAFFGGETLNELRNCLERAEIEVRGGVSPRVAPFADLRDIGGLLQRAGFALPVTDQDRITVTYESAFALMRDLRAMGETNALVARERRFTPRMVFLRAAELYQQGHAVNGRIPATFDINYLAGWAPHASQQKPLRPGAAQTRLAEALGSTERSAGEKAGPER